MGGAPWHDAEGQVGGIVVFSEDISERKASEERSARSAERGRPRREIYERVVRRKNER